MADPVANAESADPKTAVKPDVKGDYAGHDLTLVKWCEQNGIKARKLADWTGMSVATATNWLNGKMPGKVAAFEAKVYAARDRIARQSLKIVVDAQFIPMNISAICQKAFDHAIDEKDFCTLTGPAGCGKTSGVKHCCAVFKDTLYVNIFEHNRTRWGFQREVCALFGVATWPEVLKRWQGMHAMLVIDDAQKLNNDAKWLIVDAFKEIGEPLLMVGNEYMLDDIRGRDAEARRRNEQRARLIGAQYMLDRYDDSGQLLPLFARAEVASVVEQHLPDAPAKLVEYAHRAANMQGQGHLGTLRNVLLKTQKYLLKQDDAVRCFLTAWALVRPKVALLSVNELAALAEAES